MLDWKQAFDSIDHHARMIGLKPVGSSQLESYPDAVYKFIRFRRHAYIRLWSFFRMYKGRGVVGGPGDPGALGGWERNHCVHQRKKTEALGYTMYSYAIGEVRFGLVKEVRLYPLFLPCARAVSPRLAFNVCRLTAATLT